MAHLSPVRRKRAAPAHTDHRVAGGGHSAARAQKTCVWERWERGKKTGFSRVVNLGCVGANDGFSDGQSVATGGATRAPSEAGADGENVAVWERWERGAGCDAHGVKTDTLAVTAVPLTCATKRAMGRTSAIDFGLKKQENGWKMR